MRILNSSCAIVLLTSLPSIVYAGFLPAFSGNSRGISEADSDLDFTGSFAALNRDGNTGDVFGTGLADFDSRFLAGQGSPAFDTGAQYLYLRQWVNDGSGSEPFDSLGIPGTPITSWGVWNLKLADNDGVISPSNPFGANNTMFVVGGSPPTIGVHSPAVVNSMVDDIPTTFSRNNDFYSLNISLNANEVVALIGFTSDAPPLLVPSSPETCSDDFACTSGVFPKLLGDYDYNGTVNSSDYAQWKAAFGNPTPYIGFGSDGNFDGVVDLADYTIWRNNLSPGAASFGGRTVPEPSALAVLVIFLSIGWYKRNHNRL